MKILLVEDNINDAKIIIRILKAEYDDLYAYRIDTEAEYRRELKSNYDIILSDYSMPDFDGMRALKIRNEEYPLMPFIIVTGSVNEMTAVDCLIAGADNYIIKEHQNRLLPAIKKAIQDKNNEKIRIEYEKKLKEINIKYTELVENYGNWFNIPYAITYFYNVYGQREISSGQYATLIALFKEKTLKCLFKER